MKRQGFSLIEVLFSLGLSALVLAGLFLLTRGSTRQFELSSSQVFLGQRTREAVEDSLSFAASAVSPLTESAEAIYSPVAGCSEDDAAYPNIYSLDFVSCCDFLDPRFAEQPELTQGYLDRRGSRRFRYRIRYDLDKEQLLLERIADGTPAPPFRPDADPAVPVQVLCHSLRRVTFGALGNTVQMSVEAATVDKDGQVHGGLQETDNRKSLDPNVPVRNQARRLQLFTVVTIPSRTTR